MSRLTIQREIQTCFKRVFNTPDYEDRPREQEPIVWLAQIAPRHDLSFGVVKGMIDRSEVPAPPKHRHAGDEYHKVFAHAWLQLPPERRAALQAASERDYSVVEDEEEPQARRSRTRRCTAPRGPRRPPGPQNRTSGVRGVTRAGSKWLAQFFEDGVLHRLGRFDKIEDAAAAYQAAFAQRLARKG